MHLYHLWFRIRMYTYKKTYSYCVLYYSIGRYQYYAHVLLVILIAKQTGVSWHGLIWNENRGRRSIHRTSVHQHLWTELVGIVRMLKLITSHFSIDKCSGVDVQRSFIIFDGIDAHQASTLHDGIDRSKQHPCIPRGWEHRRRAHDRSYNRNRSSQQICLSLTQRTQLTQHKIW